MGPRGEPGSQGIDGAPVLKKFKHKKITMNAKIYLLNRVILVHLVQKAIKVHPV